jgi:hypothetical protein
MDASKAKPKAYDMTPAELNRFHVIVSLKSPVRTYIEKIPFQTTALNWSLTSVPEECACSDQDYESIHRELSVLIKDMMMLLRGEDEA